MRLLRPLDIAGSFEATIKTRVGVTNGTFYIINGGTRDLLGKNLRVGERINQVEKKEFPKLDR